ncbi:discoidin domain-containing protein [Streptomyces sp. B1I3]|uniref:galactose-binding domain-containing protein n=1 Tax=Streptomyces sp. B1I3 TaxID=3042264 RepID=UPI002789E60E|nr:discoidin domain-containing protein [Streptomyces sp. B1I3]MDQ0797965.1 hypothetical protein [Streptomyces sp. B1I3]
MKKILTTTVVAGIAAATVATGAPSDEARAVTARPLAKVPGPGVVLSATPRSLTADELPCRPTTLAVSMANTGKEPVFADATLSSDAPIALTDNIFSTYLPATDPDQAVTRSVGVRVPPGTAPGTYDLTVASGRQRVVVPLTVEAVPEPGPGTDLAFGQLVIASSTHGNFRTCGAVDGDSDYRNWSAGNGWNDADKGAFPDWLAVTWPEPVELGRIEVVTYGTPARPAALQGIKDFDVQVRSGGDWLGVGSYRGNTLERVVATFDPVTADAVRVVVHASNSGDYSRILEVEAFAPR